MGRYFPDEQGFSARTDVMNNLNRNVNRVGEFALAEKLRKKQQEDELKQAIELAKVKQELENKGKKEILDSIIGGTTPESPQEANSISPQRKFSGFRPKGFTYEGINFERDPSSEEAVASRSAKLSDEIAKKELSSMATNLPKLDQAFQSVGQLENLYYGIDDTGVKIPNSGATPDKNPLAARITGPFDAMKAKSGFNPALNKYIDNSKAFAGLIAKGGFGEAGMLTNQDIERVISALPNSGSTPEEAKMGFSEIKKLLGAARERFEKTKQSYLSGDMTSSRFNGQPQGQPQVNQFRGQANQSQSFNFNSEEEAAAANLPPGTQITINGRAAIWE